MSCTKHTPTHTYTRTHTHTHTHNTHTVPYLITHRECGCGSGESGCTNCGACQVCTGDGLSDQHTLMVYISSADVDIVELYERGRERVRKEKEAEERKQSEGKPKEKKKKKKDAEGVDTQTSVGSDMGIKSLFVCELCTRVSCMQECDRK